LFDFYAGHLTNTTSDSRRLHHSHSAHAQPLNPYRANLETPPPSATSVTASGFPADHGYGSVPVTSSFGNLDTMSAGFSSPDWNGEFTIWD
jgi:hypothetical protein